MENQVLSQQGTELRFDCIKNPLIYNLHQNLVQGQIIDCLQCPKAHCGTSCREQLSSLLMLESVDQLSLSKIFKREVIVDYKGEIYMKEILLSDDFGGENKRQLLSRYEIDKLLICLLYQFKDKIDGHNSVNLFAESFLNKHLLEFLMGIENIKAIEILEDIIDDLYDGNLDVDLFREQVQLLRNHNKEIWLDDLNNPEKTRKVIGDIVDLLDVVKCDFKFTNRVFTEKKTLLEFLEFVSLFRTCPNIKYMIIEGIDSKEKMDFFNKIQEEYFGKPFYYQGFLFN